MGRVASHAVTVPTVLFILLSWTYIATPVHQLADSTYALLLSQNLGSRGTVYLDEFFPPDFATPEGGTNKRPRPYQLDAANGHVIYKYPPGTSILSVPLVLAANAVGLGIVDDRGQYQKGAEQNLQAVGAGLVTAITAVVLYLCARTTLSTSMSVVVALAAGLGTSLFSTASRVLWSHSLELLFISLTIYLLLQIPDLKPGIVGPLMGSILSWTFLVRPTAIIPIALILCYLTAIQRRAVPGYLAAIMIWLGAFAAFFVATVGTPLPAYFRGEQNTPSYAIGDIISRFLGLIVSPGRGLLVYTPVVLVVVVLVICYWRILPRRSLALLATTNILAQIALVMNWTMWWGGHSYGPRLLIETIPWFVLLGILGLRAAQDRALSATSWFNWRSPYALGAAALLTLSVVINARGALDWGTLEWNGLPDIDQNTGRLWDWGKPPFLATEQLRKR